MPKINQEEYEVLRKVLSDGYEWIARDSHNPLCAHRHKPVKQDHWIQQYRGIGGNGYKEIDDRLFQFIQWEDEEPYNIAELIEEYENEETEVKKELEWGTGSYEMPLDDFLDKLEDGGVDTAKLVIEESEETEVKKDKKWFIEEMDSMHRMRDPERNPDEWFISKSALLKALEQLDEPETLSGEWIGDNVEYAYYITPSGHYSSATAVIDPKKLKGILVPKQEEIKVTLKEFEFIKESKVRGESLHDFVHSREVNRDNCDHLVDAWLAYPNIQVEEEPKYVIKLNDDESYLQRYEIDNKNTVTPFRIFGHLKEVAIIFDDKEKAEKVASLVGGEVEELEE